MTVGVQADRLYVGDTLVWDASAGVASGVPSAVGFDCDNYSSSAAVVAWGPVEVQAGDVLVMAVMHRQALTVPDGWTLHASAYSPGTSQATAQSTSILTRRYTTAGPVSGTVTQAAPARMQVGVVNMRGVASVVSRPDLTAVVSKPTETVPIPGKTRPGVVMWALSCFFWATATATVLPYSSMAVRPWSASPGMWAPEWTPSGNNPDNSRLGMFLDVSDPGPRTFANMVPSTDDAVPIVAVELVGT